MSSLAYARRPKAATKAHQQAQLVMSDVVFQLTGGAQAGELSIYGYKAS